MPGFLSRKERVLTVADNIKYNKMSTRVTITDKQFKQYIAYYVKKKAITEDDAQRLLDLLNTPQNKFMDNLNKLREDYA